MLKHLLLFLPLLCCATTFAQDAATPLQLEAARFAKEAEFLENTGKLDEALEMMEVAVALQPENLDHRGQLWRMLAKQIRIRLTEKNNKFEYDNKLCVNRVDTETMQQVVRDILRLETLATTFPNGNYILTGRQYEFNQALIPLVSVVNHVHPDFKNEIRSLNLRMQSIWMEECYRPSLNRVVDQKTFQNHLYNLRGFGIHKTIDLVETYAEIIRDTLRLSQEYELEGDNLFDINDVRLFSDLCRDFSSFFVRFHSEKIADTNPEAAVTVEQTIRLMERHSRWVPRICAWLARNQIDPYEYDSNLVRYDGVTTEKHFRMLKSYISDLPKGMKFTDTEILYDKLAKLVTERNGGYILHNTPNLSTTSLLAEIMELADSRNEFAYYAVYQYISQIGSIMGQDIDKTGFLKLREQYDPLALRQIALAERLTPGIFVEQIRKQATNTGIGHSPGNAVISRPWKSEINLLPEYEIFAGIRPKFRGNILYCVAWKWPADEFHLGCINMDTFERRYIPFPNNDARRNFFIYVDDENAYYQIDVMYGKGLLVQPLDGSKAWSLTLKDDLPSDDIHILGTLDGWCYAKLGDDWVIRINLTTRKWEQLSSSRAKEGKTPFFDGRQLKEYHAVDDPKRERIFLAAGRSGAFGWSLWTIEKDGTFHQIDLGHDCPHDLWGLYDDGSKLLCGYGLYIYDCETGSVTPSGVRHMYCGCLWNGHVWGVINGKWGRYKMNTTEEVEPLPVPDEIPSLPNVERSYWAPRSCDLAPGGNGLIVSSNGVLVFLQFE